MRKIFTIGESLLDIIFENNIPVAAIPGGSILNTSVSLAKAGNTVSIISELGNDDVGKMILESLRNNNIETNNIQLYAENQTTIALAFLDKNKNASYTIHKNYPIKRFLSIPQISSDDLLMFGSIYGITSDIRTSVLDILKAANQNNALIIYDPNIRKHKELPHFQTYIQENIKFSDLVKASDEDIYNIFGNISYQEVYHKITEWGGKNLIITQNKNNVLFFSEDFQFETKIPDIKVISTIGAGDAFNAGIIHEILKKNINKQQLLKSGTVIWKKIIESGITFATDVCMSYENSISEELSQKLKNI